MPVTVVLSKYAGGVIQAKETLKEGNLVAVDGLGNLHVRRSSGTSMGDVLAVYAPGEWLRAWTVEDVPFEKSA